MIHQSYFGRRRVATDAAAISIRATDFARLFIRRKIAAKT
jgi:hypothetical protein